MSPDVKKKPNKFNLPCHLSVDPLQMFCSLHCTNPRGIYQKVGGELTFAIKLKKKEPTVNIKSDTSVALLGHIN